MAYANEHIPIKKHIKATKAGSSRAHWFLVSASVVLALEEYSACHITFVHGGELVPEKG